MKKVSILAISGAIILVGGSVGYACQSCGCQTGKSGGHSHPEAPAAQAAAVVQIVEVNNKICPVMGNEIKAGEAIKVVHEGKIYNLCCSGCVAKFKENPEMYIEKIRQQMSEE